MLLLEQFSHVLLLNYVIQCTHKDHNKNKPGVDTVIILFGQCPRCVCYFLSIEHSVFMAFKSFIGN